MTLDEIFDRTIPEPNSGCWLWDGCVNTNGYAMVRRSGHTLTVHRISYKTVHGTIPDGLHIDHLCRVKCCVNPIHLEAVSSKENTMRGIGISANNSKKEFCHTGHEFTEENTYYYINVHGYRARQCRRCNRERRATRRSLK